MHACAGMISGLKQSLVTTNRFQGHFTLPLFTCLSQIDTAMKGPLFLRFLMHMFRKSLTTIELLLSDDNRRWSSVKYSGREVMGLGNG